MKGGELLLVDLVRTASEQMSGGAGLDVDRRHRMGDAVVEVLGDPQAILRQPALEVEATRSRRPRIASAASTATALRPTSARSSTPGGSTACRSPPGRITMRDRRGTRRVVHADMESNDQADEVDQALDNCNT